MNFVNAMNAVANKPWAVLVLVLGIYTLILCKKYGLDPTIAGGIIGVASNMLTSKPEPPDLPPGTTQKLSTETSVVIPPVTDPKV